MQVVKISADNNFKYRIDGSHAWISLQGGSTHSLSLPEGMRVELKSNATISHMKIQGAVSNIKITDSEISNLKDSFKGTNMLENAEIHTALNIVDVSGAFEDSGVISFDIPFINAQDLSRSFKNTNRLIDADIILDNATNIDEMFENSKVRTIDGMMSFSRGDVSGSVKGASNLNKIDGIKMNTYSNESLDAKKFYGSDEMVKYLGIDFVRGKVSVRKIYTHNDENDFDVSKTFEMDMVPLKETLRIDSDNLADVGLSKEIHPAKVFEMDIIHDSIIAMNNRDILPNELGVNKQADLAKTFEMDISYSSIIPEPSRASSRHNEQEFDTSNDLLNKSIEIDFSHKNALPKNTRVDQEFLLDSQLDESIDSSKTIELDIIPGKSNSIRSSVETHENQLNEDSDISTYGLELDIISGKSNSIRSSEDRDWYQFDEDSDMGTKTIELDIVPGHYIHDVLGDDSCIFDIGRTNDIDRISGIEAVPHSGSHTKKIIGTKKDGGVVQLSCSTKITGITSEEVREHLMKNMFIKFYIKSVLSNNEWISDVEIANGNTRLGLRAKPLAGNKFNIEITLREADSASYHGETIPYEMDNSIGEVYSVAITESDVENDYNVYIDGILRHTYTLIITEIPPVDFKLILNGGNATNTPITNISYMIFNRKLSQSDIEVLDSQFK